MDVNIKAVPGGRSSCSVVMWNLIAVGVNSAQ